MLQCSHADRRSRAEAKRSSVDREVQMGVLSVSIIAAQGLKVDEPGLVYSHPPCPYVVLTLANEVRCTAPVWRCENPVWDRARDQKVFEFEVYPDDHYRYLH